MAKEGPGVTGAKSGSHPHVLTAKLTTQLGACFTVEPGLFGRKPLGTNVAYGVADPDRERSEMVASATQQHQLLRNRNKTVAKSFYRQLKTEGFSHEQIIELSTTLLDLVTTDIQSPGPSR